MTKNIKKKRITIGTKQFVPMFEQFLNESEEMEDDEMEMEETSGGEEESEGESETEETEMESGEGDDEGESEEETEEEVEERIQEAYRRGLAKGKKLGKLNEGLNDPAVQAAIKAVDLEVPARTDDATFIAGLNAQFPNSKWEMTRPDLGKSVSKGYTNSTPTAPDPNYKKLYIFFPNYTTMQEITVKDEGSFPVVVSLDVPGKKANWTELKSVIGSAAWLKGGDIGNGWAVKTLKDFFTEGFKP